MVLKAIWTVVAFASAITVFTMVSYLENDANSAGVVHFLILAIGLVGGMASLHGLDKEV